MTEDYTRYVITLERNSDVPRGEGLVREHVSFLKQLEAEGRLVLAGPFEGGGGGLLVIRADSLREAQASAMSDPFVTSGAATCQVRALTLSCDENGHLGMG
jgi:uncharacterized protein YciI